MMMTGVVRLVWVQLDRYGCAETKVKEFKSEKACDTFMKKVEERNSFQYFVGKSYEIA